MRNSIFLFKKVISVSTSSRKKTCTEKLNIRPSHCSLPALPRGHSKMSLCHRGHTTKKVSQQCWELHKKEKNTTQYRVLSWTLLQHLLPAFSVLLDWKGDNCPESHIMKTGKLERAPHCLLSLKFHPCFSRICLKTPSHSHLRETAGLQRQKTEQLATNEGCQLQKEKLRIDTEKHCSSYLFIAIFRQYKKASMQAGSPFHVCLSHGLGLAQCSHQYLEGFGTPLTPCGGLVRSSAFIQEKKSEFSMSEFYNWVHLGACQFREGR